MGTIHINMAGDVTTNPQFEIDTSSGKIKKIKKNAGFVHVWLAAPGKSTNMYEMAYDATSGYIYCVAEENTSTYLYRAHKTDLSTWTRLSMPTHPHYYCTAADGAVYTASGKVLYKSDDHGATWSTFNTFTSTGTSISRIIVDGNTIIIILNGASYCYCFYSTNAGSTWSSEVCIYNGAAYNSCSGHAKMPGGNTVLLLKTAGGAYGTAYSTDSGATWGFASGIAAGGNLGIGNLSVDITTGYFYVCFISSTAGERYIYRSTNSGVSFATFFTPDYTSGLSGPYGIYFGENISVCTNYISSSNSQFLVSKNKTRWEFFKSANSHIMHGVFVGDTFVFGQHDGTYFDRIEAIHRIFD